VYYTTDQSGFAFAWGRSINGKCLRIGCSGECLDKRLKGNRRVVNIWTQWRGSNGVLRRIFGFLKWDIAGELRKMR
jgi:hypothetical protein